MSCDIDLGVTPARDTPLAERLAAQGALTRMPGLRRRYGRARSALLWAAVIGGLAIAWAQAL
jgi:hypothetical protein